jgi:hypothetical protein
MPPMYSARFALTGALHFSMSSLMIVVTNGAISKSAKLLPPPAFAKPFSSDA